MEKEMKKYAFYNVYVGNIDRDAEKAYLDKETKRLQDFFGDDVKVFGTPSRTDYQHKIEVINF